MAWPKFGHSFRQSKSEGALSIFTSSFAPQRKSQTDKSLYIQTQGRSTQELEILSHWGSPSWPALLTELVSHQCYSICTGTMVRSLVSTQAWATQDWSTARQSRLFGWLVKLFHYFITFLSVRLHLNTNIRRDLPQDTLTHYINYIIRECALSATAWPIG